MAHQYASLNKTEVIEELGRRGYGLNATGQWALSLNTPTGKRRKYDGLQRRVPLPKGVTQRELNRILASAEDEKQAAQMCIDICEGRQPNLPHTRADAADVDERVREGVREGVKEALAALGIDGDAVQLLASGQGRVTRKPGRPKKLKKDLEKRVTPGAPDEPAQGS